MEEQEKRKINTAISKKTKLCCDFLRNSCNFEQLLFPMEQLIMYSWSDGHRVPATVAGNKYSYEQIFCPALRCDWLRVVKVFFLPLCSFKEQTCTTYKQCWSFLLNTKLNIKTKRLHNSDKSNVPDIVSSLYHTFTQTSDLVVMNNW